jgi:hypothetical protein
VSVTLVFTNFYVFVLYFAAERLKFAFIFLLLSLVYSARKKISTLFALAAVFTHVQQMLIYAGLILSNALESVWYILRTYRVGSRHGLLVLAIGLAGGTLFFFLGDLILYKISYYSSRTQGVAAEIWKSLLLLFLTLLYSKERLRIFSLFAVLILASTVVGDGRVNLLSYFVFLYYALQHRRGVNIGVALTSFYYGVKSIFFVINVLESGQGFA